MTRHQIEMDFRLASRQAERLEDTAAELLRMAQNQLPDTMRDLQANWTGDASAQYLEKCEALRRKLLCDARQMEDTAAAIRRAARRLYNAEMESLRLAQERAVQG